MKMRHHNVLVMVSPMGERHDGIARFAREHGWYLMLHDHLRHTPLFWHGDGVLVTIRDDTQTSSTLAAFRRRGIPVVDLTAQRPDIDLPRVTSDNAAIGRLAAEHFSERLFRHAAWFSLSWSNVHRLRFKGFADSCRELGISPPQKWIYSRETRAIRSKQWNDFSEWIADKLRSSVRPLAVLTYDETDAVRLLSACLDIGVSVPEEVAILSVGNNPLLCDNQIVPISSIDQNLEAHGYKAASMLQQLLEGNPPPKNPILIQPKGVILRQSTDTTAVNDPMLCKALIYITKHLAQFKTEELAEALGMRRYALDRMFAKKHGHSVGTEVHRQRLITVRRMLIETTVNINEIAEQTGFCNAAYLTNVFRGEYGIAPDKWRRLRRKERLLDVKKK